MRKKKDLKTLTKSGKKEKEASDNDTRYELNAAQLCATVNVNVIENVDI